MKRSEINNAIREFEAKLEEYRFALPPYLSWTPEEWKTRGSEYDEIRDNMLGWDITDYGLNNFKKTGLSLITLRNGNVNDKKYTKTYAEKIMYLVPGQLSPNHFHWHKMEDIINRGGGKLGFHLWKATKDEKLSEEDVEVFRDGHKYKISAGNEVLLDPGESLTLYPYTYHEFYVLEAPTLIGEVSQCNDDNTDNRFYDMPARFPTIEEDEAPYRLLCSEYPKA